MLVVSHRYTVTIVDRNISDDFDNIASIIAFVEDYPGEEISIKTEVMVEDDEGNWKTIPCPQEDNFVVQ